MRKMHSFPSNCNIPIPISVTNHNIIIITKIKIIYVFGILFTFMILLYENNIFFLILCIYALFY